MNIMSLTEIQEIQKYTSYGSYPIFGVTTKNEAICVDCIKHAEKREIRRGARLHKFRKNEGIVLICCEINWESDILCDFCETKIETAYGIFKEGENHASL